MLVFMKVILLCLLMFPFFIILIKQDDLLNRIRRENITKKEEADKHSSYMYKERLRRRRKIESKDRKNRQRYHKEDDYIGSFDRRNRRK